MTPDCSHRVIGPCVLLCADSLGVLPHVTGMDLVVSDVPYLLTTGGATEGGLHERFGTGGKKYDNGGNLFEGECPKWSEFMPLLFSCLRPNAHCYTMADSKNQFEMQIQAKAAGFRFHNLLYWDKETVTPNRWYMKHTEYVGFFFKGKGFAINNCGSRQGTRMKHRDETGHPTEKPVNLMRHYIENSSQPGETVCDPFMGTGTTGVAAVLSGRRFFGIERDPKWFAVACDRIQAAVKSKGT